MPSYQELIAQKNALDKRIEEARSTEAKEALATVKQLIATFGFTSQQVFPGSLKKRKRSKPGTTTPKVVRPGPAAASPEVDRRQGSRPVRDQDHAYRGLQRAARRKNPFPVQ
jgi:DNA-binding protein H-NS